MIDETLARMIDDWVTSNPEHYDEVVEKKYEDIEVEEFNIPKVVGNENDV